LLSSTTASQSIPSGPAFDNSSQHGQGHGESKRTGKPDLKFNQSLILHCTVQAKEGSSDLRHHMLYCS